MVDSVLGLLRKKIRHEMNELADAMAIGSCVNIEEYRQMVGKVEGLAWLEREIIDLEERMNNPDTKRD